MNDEQDPASNVQANEKQPLQVPTPPDILKEIPDEKRQELIQYFSRIVYIEETSGPLPPPSMLAAYSLETQKIIVEEWSNQGPHRRKLEERVFETSAQHERRGMWLGFFLALSLIVGGTAVILAGYSAAGLVLISADAAALAIIYVVDRRNSRD